MDNYEVWLTADTGLRLAQLDISLGLNASKEINKIGWFSLNLPKSFDIDFIKPDRMVQIWRKPKYGAMGLWGVYFLRKWTFSDQSSRETILIEGPDIKDLLRRRICAAFSGSPQSNKTDYADDAMKEIVTESLADGVAPIPTAGTRVWSNLSVQGDLGLGPIITKSFSFDYLLTSSGGGILPTWANAAKEEGTEVFFDVVPNVVSSNSITFEFRTDINQPGIDVSDRVVFDKERGNLKDCSLQHDHSEEENYIYTGGQEEGSNRNIQQVYDATRYNQSIWGRCEGFADARNETSDNGAISAGHDKLNEGRPKIKFVGSPMDTKSTRFGIEWDFGYKVKTRYRNIEFNSIIRAVTLSVDKNGEKIQAKLEYEA